VLEGTNFEFDIDVRSDDVETAAAKLAQMNARFEESKSAAARAAEAVREGRSAYDEAEKTAARAALAVERIGLKADAQRGKLEEAMKVGDEQAFWRAATAIEKLNAAQEKAKVAADAAKQAMDAQARTLDKLAEAEKSAEAKQTAMSQSLAKGKDAMKAVEQSAPTGKLNELAAGFGRLGGPLGRVGQQAAGSAEGVKKLVSSLGAAGPYVAIAVALVAIVAGMVAIAAAAIAGTAKIAQWSMSLADAARTQRLMSDGMAGSVAGGAILDAKITSLSKRVPIASEELQSMAKQLSSTGLRGQALADSLETAAIKAAKMKFGPNFSKEMLSLDNQSKTFHSNIAGLFGGMTAETERAEGGLAKLVALFDANTESGKAIKSVFESLFKPLLNGIGDTAPKAERLFLQFEIWAMKALIALKPHGSQILKVGEALGILAAVVMGALAIAVGAIIVGLAMSAVVIGAVIAAIVALIAGVVWLVVKLTDLGNAAGTWVVNAFKSAIAFLQGISLREIGTRIIEGLANGIIEGGAAVLRSISNVVTGAIDSAKKLLSISSPSKVFAEIGGNTTAGFVQGVDDGAGDAQSSLESMVAPPEAQPVARASRAATDDAGSENGSFVIQIFAPDGSADGIASKVREVVLSILDGDVASLGAAVPA